MNIKAKKIQEQLHYFNIHSEMDSVYGNWIVTKNGDVVNFEYPIAVLSVHLYDQEWQKQIEGKEWLDSSYKEEFKKAIKRARNLFPAKNLE